MTFRQKRTQIFSLSAVAMAIIGIVISPLVSLCICKSVEGQSCVCVAGWLYTSGCCETLACCDSNPGTKRESATGKLSKSSIGPEQCCSAGTTECCVKFGTNCDGCEFGDCDCSIRKLQPVLMENSPVEVDNSESETLARLAPVYELIASRVSTVEPGLVPLVSSLRLHAFLSVWLN